MSPSSSVSVANVLFCLPFDCLLKFYFLVVDVFVAFEPYFYILCCKYCRLIDCEQLKLAQYCLRCPYFAS